MKFILNWVWGAAPAAAVAVVLAAAPAPDAAEAAAGACDALAERAELVMGTVARVALCDASDPTRAFDAAFAALRSVDATMSLHRPDSELVRVNSHAGRHPEPVGAELFELLARARSLSAATDGAFDVTVLPLLRLWGAYPELSYLPSGTLRAVGWGGLRLDPVTRSVGFARPGMGIDLGGIAKGFALDLARAGLVARGERTARLDLGGMLAFVGAAPGGGAWRVAVRDPEAPDTALGVLEVPPNTAVSTSGNYARDFGCEGWRERSHVYDPRSGRPVTAVRAVTVWGADATTADALSTALLVLGPAEAGRVLARIPETGALLVDGRGARRLTFAGRAPVGWTAPRGPDETDRSGEFQPTVRAAARPRR